MEESTVVARMDWFDIAYFLAEVRKSPEQDPGIPRGEKGRDRNVRRVPTFHIRLHLAGYQNHRHREGSWQDWAPKTNRQQFQSVHQADYAEWEWGHMRAIEDQDPAGLIDTTRHRVMDLLKCFQVP